MLDTFMPGATIDGAVSPAHLSEALSFIADIATSVGVARLPLEEAPAVFLISEVIAFVLISFGVWWKRGVKGFPPLSVSVFEAVFEGALISVPVHPLVLAIALWLPVLILSNVHVSIGEEIGTVAVPEACLPFALVPVSIEPYMHAISFSLAGLPLADV
jgi:hypothetical protein